MPKKFVAVIFVFKDVDYAEVKEFIEKAKKLTKKIVEVREVEAIL